MRFTKMEGLGNDFLVVDDRDARSVDWPEAARRVCDRRRGVGGDGVLVIQRATDDGEARSGELRMRLFNADGSEAEMCGNGVRCVALLVADAGIAGGEVVWETGAGPVRTELLGDGMVRVAMGEPRFRAVEVPVVADDNEALDLELEAAGRRVRVSVLGMGNPHCVVVVDDVDAAPVGELGPALERHQRFPNRTNVEFVQVVSRTRVRQRTFERGVGETDACGTGACAAMVALCRRGLVDARVDVELRGGTLVVEWPDEGEVLMTGPARAVFSGEVAVPLLRGAAS